MYIEFDDIRCDVDNKIEAGRFKRWHDETIELILENKDLINYKNWLKT